MLERRAGAGAVELAPQLSLHFLQAEDYEKAWRYSVAVGELAQRRSANVVAAELYERALAAADHLELPPDEVARIAEALGDVCELAARYEQADQAYGRARGLHEDGTRAGAADAKGGHRLRAAGELPRGTRLVLARARRHWTARRRWTGSRAGSELELATAGIKYRQGNFTEGVDWSTRAAEHAEAAENRAALGHAYFLLHLNRISLGEQDDEHARLALPMLEEAGDLVLQSNVVNNLGIEAYFAGRWDEASELYRRSGELSGRAGDVVNVARAQNNEGEILSDQGRLEEAEELFLEAQRVWRAARYPVGIALATSNLGTGRRSRRPVRRGAGAARRGAGGASRRSARRHSFTRRRPGGSSASCSRVAIQEALEGLPAVLEASRRAAARLAPSSSGCTATRSCRLAGPSEADARFERSLELGARARGRLRGGADAGSARQNRPRRPGGRRREPSDFRAHRRSHDAGGATALNSGEREPGPDVNERGLRRAGQRRGTALRPSVLVRSARGVGFTQRPGG